MTPQASDPLAQLRDIHLPEPVSWWPPAPGWWILALLALCVVVTGAILVSRHYRNNTYRRQALAALENSYQQSAENPTLFCHQVLELLRRTTRTLTNGEPVASYSTAKLLETLNRGNSADIFSPELCQQLAELPYQQNPVYPPQFSETLYKSAQCWLKKHKSSHLIQHSSPLATEAPC
jgi:hypothetical protein